MKKVPIKIDATETEVAGKARQNPGACLRRFGLQKRIKRHDDAFADEAARAPKVHVDHVRCDPADPHHDRVDFVDGSFEVNALGPDEFDPVIPVKKFLLNAQIGDQTGSVALGGTILETRKRRACAGSADRSEGRTARVAQDSAERVEKHQYFPSCIVALVLTSPK